MRRPLGRFLALGALLFAVDLAVAASGPPSSSAPAPAALSDEELLFREALARGWHRRDPVVRLRLARNMRFLLEDAAADGAAPPDEEALVREAIALGMHESDLVVRRRLVQKMELLAQEAVRLDPPDDAALAAWLARHEARFREPARVRLLQAFFRSRSAAERAADRAAARGAEALAEVAGDPLPMPRALPSYSQAELAARLGPELAARAFAAPEGAVVGPVRSPYGWHVLRVRGRRAARAPRLPRVRSQVREALQAERAEAARAAQIERLRARWDAPS